MLKITQRAWSVLRTAVFAFVAIMTIAVINPLSASAAELPPLGNINQQGSTPAASPAISLGFWEWFAIIAVAVVILYIVSRILRNKRGEVARNDRDVNDDDGIDTGKKFKTRDGKFYYSDVRELGAPKVKNGRVVFNMGDSDGDDVDTSSSSDNRRSGNNGSGWEF